MLSMIWQYAAPVPVCAPFQSRGAGRRWKNRQPTKSLVEGLKTSWLRETYRIVQSNPSRSRHSMTRTLISLCGRQQVEESEA